MPRRTTIATWMAYQLSAFFGYQLSPRQSTAFESPPPDPLLHSLINSREDPVRTDSDESDDYDDNCHPCIRFKMSPMFGLYRERSKMKLGRSQL